MSHHYPKNLLACEFTRDAKGEHIPLWEMNLLTTLVRTVSYGKQRSESIHVLLWGLRPREREVAERAMISRIYHNHASTMTKSSIVPLLITPLCSPNEMIHFLDTCKWDGYQSNLWRYIKFQNILPHIFTYFHSAKYGYLLNGWTFLKSYEW